MRLCFFPKWRHEKSKNPAAIIFVDKKVVLARGKHRGGEEEEEKL